MGSRIPPKDYVESVEFPAQITLEPIGVVHSPHRERHGTPRQASVVADRGERPEEAAVIEVFPSLLPAEALTDIAGFEYLWVISWMHLNRGWNPTVIPPRGPRVRRGVLATRAPHRPNQLALSAARLTRVDGHRLHFERLDLLDGTPVLDIKPYLPYADAFPGAAAGWVDGLDEPS